MWDKDQVSVCPKYKRNRKEINRWLMFSGFFSIWEWRCHIERVSSFEDLKRWHLLQSNNDQCTENIESFKWQTVIGRKCLLTKWYIYRLYIYPYFRITQWWTSSYMPQLFRKDSHWIYSTESERNWSIKTEYDASIEVHTTLFFQLISNSLKCQKLVINIQDDIFKLVVLCDQQFKSQQF